MIYYANNNFYNSTEEGIGMANKRRRNTKGGSINDYKRVVMSEPLPKNAKAGKVNKTAKKK